MFYCHWPALYWCDRAFDFGFRNKYECDEINVQYLSYVLQLVEGFEFMRAQKEAAEERARDALAKFNNMAIDYADLREKMSGLEAMVTEYKKLDIVAEMMQQEHLVESIGEINATIHRYDPATQHPATAPAVPPDEDGNASLNASAHRGGSSPARPTSPSQLALQARCVCALECIGVCLSELVLVYALQGWHRHFSGRQRQR